MPCSSCSLPLRTLLSLCCLLLAGSCAQNDHPPPPAPPGQESPAAASSAEAEAAAAGDLDYGCSYFYFLWGRHAEMSAQYDAALEAYEKALICDPTADSALRKIPALLLRLNRGGEATVQLRKYLAAHPNDKASRLLLAKIFLREGKFEDAVGQFRQLHELNPDDPAPLLLLSEAYVAGNKPEQAKETLEEAAKADSGSFAHVLLARLLTAEGNLAQSREHYQQALAANPSAGLQLELAEVLLKEKEYAQAVKICQELVAHDELNQEARIALIHLHLLQNEQDKAMTELKRLKEIAGSAERMELILAKLHLSWEEQDKAAVLLEALLQQEDLAEVRYLLAILRLQQKQPENALSILEKISPAAKEYEDGLLLQVRILRAMNRQPEMLRLLEAALAANQQLSAGVYVLLASLHQAAEQEDACLQTFERGRKMHPDSEELLYQYGIFLNASGKKAQAMKIMQQLVTKNPDHAGALNYVGYMWAEENKHLNKAFLYLSRAAKIEPDNGNVHDSLGWTYYRLRKFAEARKELDLADRLLPNNPAVLNHLAEVCLAAGKSDEALAFWRRAIEIYNRQEQTEQGKKLGAQEAQELKRMQEEVARLEKKI